MKRILLFTLLLLQSGFLLAQNVPNRGFETWTTHYLAESFKDWTTSNTMFQQNGIDTFNVSPSADAAFGSLSAYLATMEFMSDTIPAFIISGGYIEGDSTGLVGIGGVPFTAQPDSMVYYAKYDLPAGDTGIALVLFKAGGVQFKTMIFPVVGTQSAWTRYAVPMGSYSQTPDSVMVGFASTNPDHPALGGWLMVDGVSFTGTAQNVFNPGFEDVDTVGYSNPDGWISTNQYSAAFGEPEALQATTDAHSGQLAMRIEPVFFESFQGSWGYMLTGNTPNDFSGGFAYNHQPTKLSGWYKYTTQSTDTAMIMLVVTHHDTLGDSTITLGGASIILTAASAYTYFEFPVQYNPAYLVDSANIIITPSKAMFGGNPDSVKLGSVLFLDDLWLHGQCDWTDTTSIFPVDTLSGCAPYTLGAGTFDSYLWSTGATSSTISIDSSGSFSVTVMDTASCSLSEAVYVIAVTCPGFADAQATHPLTIYPNPSTGLVHVIQENGSEALQLSLFAADGRKLQEQVLAVGGLVEIDLGMLPDGMYILRAAGKEHQSEHRLIKQ